MEAALVIALLTIGAAAGSLITFAWMVDRTPRSHDITETQTGDIL